VVHLPVALADQVRRNLCGGSCKLVWQNMLAYQTMTKDPSPHINSEMRLVSRMEHTMKILLCPLVLVVNIDDAVSTKGVSYATSTDETKKCSALR
jgi:hypothetical protein